MAIRIAVDAMGGDNAPAVVIEGALRALRRAPEQIHLFLVGPAERLREALKEYETEGLPVDILDAPEVIGMAETPAAAVKNKPRSSIHVGLGAHKQGIADAFVSAGSTGAIMAAALFILGRLPNVSRPSVPGFFPTTKSYSIVLDLGANVDCKPEHLAQFARMGAIYAERIMRREAPIVALMNVGEEPGKGNEQTKAAYKVLEKTPGIRFRGNIEGRDLMHHGADVVVCDGFIGNIMLKLGESMATAFVHMIAEEMRAQGLSQEEKHLVAKVLGEVRKKFNYEEYGGTPLLGVAGNVLIGHGSSTARAIEQMIMRAAEVARQDIVGFIEAAFASQGSELEKQ